MNIRTFTYAVENYLHQHRTGRITLDEAERAIKAEITTHLETMEADHTRWLKQYWRNGFSVPADIQDELKEADDDTASLAYRLADAVGNSIKGEALLRFKGFFRGIDGTY